MTERILSLRELNRATLQRQLLCERERMLVPAAIERLVGLQAQNPMPPFIGLWTRLHGFRREDLAQLIENRAVLRATLLRATLHICTAEDYLRFRTTLQPVLVQASQTITKQRGAEYDLNTILAETRYFLREKPRTLPEYDNLLLSHSQRTRVIADEYRSLVYLPGLRVRATFLVDGFVRGAWKIEKNKQAAALIIEPFAPLSAQHQAALFEEAEQLVRFVEPEANSYEIRLSE